MIMKENSYSVYYHKCPNGMFYVGCTSQTPPDRRWRDGDGYSRTKGFCDDIKKYGWTNIKHEVVANGLDKKTALDLEAALIRRCGEMCYNKQKSSTTASAIKEMDKFIQTISFNDDIFVPLTTVETTKPNAFSSFEPEFSETQTNPIKNMKSVKQLTAKSKSIYGVKVELVLDTRYKHKDNKYSVCIRFYYNRKYKYISTRFTMTPNEFLDMDKGDEALLNTAFENYCEMVRGHLANGSFNVSMVEREPSFEHNKNDMTLAQLVLERGELSRTQGTKENYKNAAKFINKIYSNGLLLPLVSKKSVGKILDYMVNKGYKPATINIHLSIIRASINYGIYKGYLKPEQYPFKKDAMEVDKITLPKSDKRDENYLTKSEMQTVWDKFKETKNKKLGWFLFSYLHGGMNIADMMQLKFTNFYFDEGGFIFQRMKTKGRNDFKTYIPATSWTHELFDIMGITPTNGEYVFKEMCCEDGKYELKKRALSNMANRELLLLNLFDKRISFTTARHSFATNATKEGMHFTMVEQAMGHALGGVSSHYIGRWDVGEMRPDFEKLL